MADIICFSGREPDEIASSFKHYSECADKVFVARHPNAEKLNFSSNTNLFTIKDPEVSFIRRIKQLLKESQSKVVFLAADDDYILKSHFDAIADLLDNNESFSTVRIITLLANRIDKDNLDLSVYLNSPYVSAKVAERSISNSISSHFYPLNLDFYSFYNREKYLFIIEVIDSFLSRELFGLIDRSGKLYQYLIAYFHLLAGNIIDYSLPIYVRGTQPPVRKQKSFREKKIVDEGQLLSFSHELIEFWNNHKARNGIVDSAMLVYEKYGYHSDFKFSSNLDKRRNQIILTLHESLLRSNDSIKNQLLHSYQDSYILRINNSDFSANSASLSNFKYVVNSTTNTLHSPFVSTALSPYRCQLNKILTVKDINDMQSFFD